MLTRRNFLHLAAASGAFAIAPELVLARGPNDNRLVVIILRGGMDALDVIQPYGDRGLKRLRPQFSRNSGNKFIDLDGFYGLHPNLKKVHRLYKGGELGFVHAVSSPYRHRSHFQGQDVLESGAVGQPSVKGGWLNRAIALTGVNRNGYALDLSKGGSYLMKGRASVTNWLPYVDLNLTEDSEFFLRELYENDPMFIKALNGALQAEEADVDDMTSSRKERRKRNQPKLIAKLAGEMLAADARIAAFSTYGWDTHGGQPHKMKRNLKQFSSILLTLKKSLGKHWQNTAVVAITEFGRTARENGTKGTDHGTGTAMIYAGGLFADGKGGKVLTTKWPGLSDDQLYKGRDLMPTDDVRRYLGWVLAHTLDLKKNQIEADVFPGADLGFDPKLV